MAEPNARAQVDQPRVLGGNRGGAGDSQLRCGLCDHGRVAGGLGRGDEEEALRVRRERLHPTKKALLNPTRQLRAAREPEAARELGGRQPPRQLKQRQRVAPRLGDDSITYLLVEPSRHHRLEESAGIGVAETREHELRQALELLHLTRIANSEHHRNRLGVEPPRDERKSRDRLQVQPLDVVEQAEERLLLREIRQQAEHGQADQERLRRGTVHEAKGPHQCVTLRCRQSLGATQGRPAAQL